MKRSWLIILFALISLSSISLVVLQIFQMRKSLEISDNLFNVSVNNAMDKIVSQFDEMKFEEYVNQEDRYKIQKFRRVDDLNSRMVDLIRLHDDLFYNENKTLFKVALQDSVFVRAGVRLSSSDSNILNQYNTLLNARHRLVSNEGDGMMSFVLGDGSKKGFTMNDINYAHLDSLIREELIINGVDLVPEIGVENETQGEFIYLSDEDMKSGLSESPYRYAFRIGVLPSTDDYSIVLYFPAPMLFFRTNEHLFMVCSIFLIVVLFVSFVFIIRIIANQRKLDEMKTTFINNMTHEVKTPIATIGLACEMLRDSSVQTDAETKMNFLNIINDETRRMRGLVETILQSSKMSNKKYSITPEEVDLHGIVNDVVGSFSLTVAQKGGRIELDLAAHPSVIFADRMHITNLVYNLVDNAIKYSSDAPVVSIATSIESNYVVLRVRDNGIGISKENQKHIFEKFYRVSTGDVHNVKGFGIGLNYVAQVVSFHKGKISVESALGKGSVFTVMLPL